MYKLSDCRYISTVYIGMCALHLGIYNRRKVYEKISNKQSCYFLASTAARLFERTLALFAPRSTMSSPGEKH